ncbi:hypothetical protein GHO41_11565 [Pseudomonas sp. FSL R10-0399]|uniref:hypothetical protein n=1 Tax=Pseudomonas sp. FSL R10-0399 TaxID=2662194 RepID=UPI001295E7BB|nr:hypothetical protein [Pseudomonas sp. FSL R10-0399]MQT57979.1 hypothetical protein [Pseudomonas sp. FSL R10-0399]
MMVDPKYKLELLVAFTIGATMTGCGFVLSAASAWMMETGWAVPAVTFLVFLVPLKAAISTYREVKPTLPGRG